MVKRRPDIVVFDWKEPGSYSEVTGRRIEGEILRTLSVPARIESAKNDFVNVSGNKKAVSINIFTDLRSLNGVVIPPNAYVSYAGERKEVVKIEPLQSHVLIWV
jgi:hypothetical protein